MRPRALYVHVPFCARRCSYCDFAVDAVRRPPVEDWLSSVAAELAIVVEREGWTRPLDPETVYVGGGTPSLLGAGAMLALRERVAGLAEWDREGVEWTAEANPESFDGGLAADWAGAGVNRVSLGVQTFHEPALRWMGRLHGAEGSASAMDAARAAGIGNVSVDLIFGLPERLGRDWASDLERSLELEPDHVSLYGLTAEPATPLGRWVRDGRERLAAEEVYEAEYLLAAERLSAAGYVHYEVSNFARPGRESRHNGVYWSGAAYLGLGPGAHSLLPPSRRWNVRDWSRYATTVAAGLPPEDGSELLDAAAKRLEGVWLGLRTRAGLATADLGDRALGLAREWARLGWAEVTAGRLRLTARGWLLLDRLAVELEGALADKAEVHDGNAGPDPAAAAVSRGPADAVQVPPRSGATLDVSASGGSHSVSVGEGPGTA